jgi:hypothetical protein
MTNKQIQEAGDNSHQLQANNMVVNVGIDEKRAREIYQEMNLQLRNDYSKEALIVAKSRVLEFENKLLPKMEAIEGALEAFADPSFQLLLVEAQKTAAASERPADYDILSELLVHRFQKGSNRTVRAGISRAVEIVDEVSDDALIGLTLFYCQTSYLPSKGGIHEGLDILNILFGKQLYRELPIYEEWCEHLEILNAIRITNFGKLKNVEEYYSIMLNGYVDVGIKKGSESHKKAIDLLNTNFISQDVLVSHELNNDYLRIPIVYKNQINESKLPETHKSALNYIYELYDKNDILKQNNIKMFMREWDNRENLKKIRIWSDNISTVFQLTSVGKALARSNAKRCDKTLPPSD